MIFGLLYFCVVILCNNRSRTSFILYRIVKRHSRQSNVRRIWTCADNDVHPYQNTSHVQLFRSGTIDLHKFTEVKLFRSTDEFPKNKGQNHFQPMCSVC